jgi:formylmethanofuran dehydrogenase subunit E
LDDESNELTSTLLDEAVKFHGHLGPFLILGLKAGLYANKVLGKDYFKTRVIVETEPKPPYSCLIDGLQITTGCTMGKGNIIIKNGDPALIRFIKGDKVIEMKLKKEIIRDLEDMRVKEDSERKSFEIMRRTINELFDINIK